MNQFKFIYNSQFKDSYSHLSHTSFPIIASNWMYLHTVPEAEYFDVDSGEDDPSEQDGHHHKDRASLPVRVTFRFLFRYHNESGTHAFADPQDKWTFYSLHLWKWGIFQ